MKQEKGHSRMILVSDDREVVVYGNGDWLRHIVVTHHTHKVDDEHLYGTWVVVNSRANINVSCSASLPDTRNYKVVRGKTMSTVMKIPPGLNFYFSLLAPSHYFNLLIGSLHLRVQILSRWPWSWALHSWSISAKRWQPNLALTWSQAIKNEPGMFSLEHSSFSFWRKGIRINSLTDRPAQTQMHWSVRDQILLAFYSLV